MEPIDSNPKLAGEVLAALKRLGCREVILCAGARNAPLVLALAKNSSLKVFSFFEERSAAFFALGRMKATGQPVAVVTTSGTAAAELLPATIESDVTGFPLLLVTADRPRRFRGVGAPQSILQLGIFSHYVAWSVDVEGNESLEELPPLERRPVHLNVCFEEPVRGVSPREVVGSGANPALAKMRLANNHSQIGKEVTREAASQRIQDFLGCSHRPAVMLGPMAPNLAEAISRRFAQWRVPLVTEALANWRPVGNHQGLVLFAGEKSLSMGLERGLVDGIIRVGSVPTARVWRDLEERFHRVPVLSFAEPAYSGLARAPEAALPFSALEFLTPPNWPDADLKVLHARDQELSRELLRLIANLPNSEVAILERLRQEIPIGARVFLGNSLPIREWDLLQSLRPLPHVFCGNRGVNGIDGQLSTFLGWADDSAENWFICGDLTAAYDLAGFWALRERPLKNIRVVVINNGGGKIFAPMFQNPAFENRHDLEFSGWAKMWGLAYVQWRAGDSGPALAAQRPTVIELKPDNEQSAAFWREWREVRSGD